MNAYEISLKTEDGIKHLGTVKAADEYKAVDELARKSPAVKRGAMNQFWVRPEGSVVELEVEVMG